MNPWATLGVHRQSADEEIKAAYYKLAKKSHPDTKKGDIDRFQDVNAAYGLLKDKAARRQFIELLATLNEKCAACSGRGVKSKSKGLTDKEYTPCKVCVGSGFNLKQEVENVTIELQSAAGVGRTRRNNKRRS